MDMPSYEAVESVLSQLEFDENIPALTDEVCKILAELVRHSTLFDPDAKIDTQVFVRGLFLSFWAGYRSARAQTQDEILRGLIKQD